MKKPKDGPKLKTKCFYYKGNGYWKRNCPKYLADKKDGKVNEGIFDIHIIDVYLTNARSRYLILVRLLIFVMRNRSYGLNEDWLRTR